MKKRCTEGRIVAILRDAEPGQKPVGEACRRHAISAPAFYAWPRRCGPMAENKARRRRELEKENGRLKRLLARCQWSRASPPSPRAP